VRALALLVLALAGCGDGGGKSEATPPPPGGRRSEVVSGKAQPTAPAATVAATSKPKVPRAICQGAPAGAGKKLPDTELAKMEEGRGTALPDAIPSGGGQWTWVNLWAGWCAPCKEEMPMLVSWEKKLREAGTPVRFAFVSIDDDERQARRFLAAQTAVTRSWRLVEGKPRNEWLTGFGLPETPELPVHLLFDGKGELRCAVTGAISEADFPRVREVVAAR
jgi:thiol-disulfide isomerase/thioredoxin